MRALLVILAACTPSDPPDEHETAAPVDTVVEPAPTPTPADTDPPAGDHIETDPRHAALPAPCDTPWCEEAARAGLLEHQWYGRSVAWVDVDGDGWDDLWMSHDFGGHAGNSHTSTLYRNMGDGQFSPLALGILPGHLQKNRVGIWADYDNDGDPDLFLGNGGLSGPAADHLYRNDLADSGVFTDVTAVAGFSTAEEMTWGASWADVNNDGHLDLVVSERRPPCLDPCEGVATGTPHPSELAAVRLYMNQGDGTFVDQAEAFGITPHVIDGAVPVWSDIDLDGDPDLVLGNNGSAGEINGEPYEPDRAGEARILLNVGGTAFVDESSSWFFDDRHREPLVAIGLLDADQDGRDDLYLGRGFERDWLYFGREGQSFWPQHPLVGLDLAEGPGSSENSWGLATGDITGDGHPDILVGPAWPLEANPAILFRNLGDGTFSRMTPEEFGEIPPSRNQGAAFSDFDRDGDIDMMWNAGGWPAFDAGGFDTRALPMLWVNHAERPGRTTALRLVGTVSNRDAIGARVTVHTTPPRHLVRRSAHGYPSQHSAWFTVAMDDLDEVDVHIVWPSGREKTVTLPAGARSTILEP